MCSYGGICPEPPWPALPFATRSGRTEGAWSAAARPHCLLQPCLASSPAPSFSSARAHRGRRLLPRGRPDHTFRPRPPALPPPQKWTHRGRRVLPRGQAQRGAVPHGGAPRAAHLLQCLHPLERRLLAGGRQPASKQVKAHAHAHARRDAFASTPGSAMRCQRASWPYGPTASSLKPPPTLRRVLWNHAAAALQRSGSGPPGHASPGGTHLSSTLPEGSTTDQTHSRAPCRPCHSTAQPCVVTATRQGAAERRRAVCSGEAAVTALLRRKCHWQARHTARRWRSLCLARASTQMCQCLAAAPSRPPPVAPPLPSPPTAHPPTRRHPAPFRPHPGSVPALPPPLRPHTAQAQQRRPTPSAAHPLGSHPTPLHHAAAASLPPACQDHLACSPAR